MITMFGQSKYFTLKGVRVSTRGIGITRMLIGLFNYSLFFDQIAAFQAMCH